MPKSPAALFGRQKRPQRPDAERYLEPGKKALPETTLPRSSRLPDWRRLLPGWGKPEQKRLTPAKSTE